MTIKPEPSVYTPPPDSACDVFVTPYDLADDPAADERHVLVARTSIYRGRVVSFSLEQTIHAGKDVYKVRRVDSAHGVVHAHRFTRRDQAGTREDLCEIPPKGHDVVNRLFYEELDKMLDEWDENLRRWREC